MRAPTIEGLADVANTAGIPSHHRFDLRTHFAPPADGMGPRHYLITLGDSQFLGGPAARPH
jgi:hypothetical protein